MARWEVFQVKLFESDQGHLPNPSVFSRFFQYYLEEKGDDLRHNHGRTAVRECSWGDGPTLISFPVFAEDRVG